MRCFIGVELPEDVVELVGRVRDSLSLADHDWRSEKWVPAENLHLTLAFLGEVTDSQLQRTISALDRIEFPAYILENAAFVAVPAAGRARVCWLEFAGGASSCALLSAKIVGELLASGVPVEVSGTGFRAHVTLVRSRRGRAVTNEALRVVQHALDDGAAPSVSVSSVTLFASRLTRARPVYEVVAKIPLAEPEQHAL